MLEITLLKSLFYETDEEHITEIRTFTNEKDAKYHRLALDLPAYPELKSMTMEVRYMAYGAAMYYLHLNDNLNVNEDINSPLARAAILYFFRTYRPNFFKKGLPEDLSKVPLLDCFDVGKIPDYRPKYAFPGLVTYEDIRSGKAKPQDPSMPTFPGIRMLNQQKDENKPAYISDNEEYTKFHGGQDELQNKLEELKKKFPVEM